MRRRQDDRQLTCLNGYQRAITRFGLCVRSLCIGKLKHKAHEGCETAPMPLGEIERQQGLPNKTMVPTGKGREIDGVIERSPRWRRGPLEAWPDRNLRMRGQEISEGAFDIAISLRDFASSAFAEARNGRPPERFGFRPFQLRNRTDVSRRGFRQEMMKR